MIDPLSAAIAGTLVLLAVLATYFVTRIRHERRLAGHLQELATLRERFAGREQEVIKLEDISAAQQHELDRLRQLAGELQAKVSGLETQLRQERLHHGEKLAMLTEAKTQLSHEFKALATQILDENSRKMAEQNRDTLDNVLQPLRHQLSDFRQKVEETYEKESQQRFSLAHEIQRLQSLNERISEDAVNLTNALKGQTKLQGAWGEVILERVLERSGLERGREYEIQVSLKDQQGQRLQPDVILYLPENRHVVIDSKVSLTAYAAYYGAEDEEQGRQFLRQHVQSVRNHIRGLSRKQYQDLTGLSSLDFVLLFIPVEGAFSAAVQAEAELFNEAFEQNIVLVSPSTLLATLRTIHNIWRYEYQSRNAQEIARQAGNLYDKFVNFVGDLQEIGQRLGGAQQAWDKAYNKLVDGKGNLVRRVESLKALGARASKSLDDSLLERAEMDEADETDKPDNGLSAASSR